MIARASLAVLASAAKTSCVFVELKTIVYGIVLTPAFKAACKRVTAAMGQGRPFREFRRNLVSPPRCACVSAQGATQQHFRSCRANAAPARAQSPAPCEINLSISAPSSVRLMRSTVLNAITASPYGINKSRAATSRWSVNVSIACSLEQINSASSRAYQRSSAGGAGLPTASPPRPDRPSVTLPKMSGNRGGIFARFGDQRSKQWSPAESR
jgi:phage-related baseplate assembly protein